MSREEWRGTRSRLLGAMVPAVVGVLGRMSFRGAQRVGTVIGALGWRLARRDRARALEHLAIAFPEKSLEERRTMARGCFRHLGMVGAECAHLMRQDCDAISEHVEVVGWENVEAAGGGRPILFVTGHCGNWEMLAAAINCRDIGMAVIARRANDPRLSPPIVQLRERFGTQTINRAEPGASRKLLTTLRDGGALGMLIDQDTQVKGTWVPFFGHPAYTPVGAAEIALRRDVAVVPIFIARLEDGSHRAVMQPELSIPDDVVEATALMTRQIEEQIRRHPEQWVWMHRRWRRQPEDGVASD